LFATINVESSPSGPKEKPPKEGVFRDELKQHFGETFREKRAVRTAEAIVVLVSWHVKNWEREGNDLIQNLLLNR